MRTIITQKDIDKFQKEQSNRDLISSSLGDLQNNNRKLDKYTERLIKYIPSEVTALYLTLDALIRSSDRIPIIVYWGIFIFGIFATYFYLKRIEKVYKKRQLIISTFAYCIWVFAIGGPFATLNWYDPIYASILLPIYTFLIPLLDN